MLAGRFPDPLPPKLEAEFETPVTPLGWYLGSPPPPLTDTGLERRLDSGTTSMIGEIFGRGALGAVAGNNDEGVGNMLPPTSGARPVPVE